MRSRSMAARPAARGGFGLPARRLLKRAGRVAALILAVLVSLPLASVAQDGRDGMARPVPRGGWGPVVELPPSWEPLPLHRYHREVLFSMELAMEGEESMGFFPMANQARQEMVMETTAWDERGRLFVRVTMGEPEVLQGLPGMTGAMTGSSPATYWIRLTRDGRWDILFSSSERGWMRGEPDGEAWVVPVLGPLWPEAPRVGSSWDVPASQLSGFDDQLGEMPDVLVTVTLEAVERVDGEEVARIVFHLPETRFEATPGDDEPPEMAAMMAGAFAQVAIDGVTQVRVRDGLALASRVDIRSVASLGVGAPGLNMRILVEEKVLGDERLALPPMVPAEILQAP